MSFKIPDESNGETAIKAILEKMGLDYVQEKEIFGLEGDYEKAFRRADFYLPQFDIYIEFAGMWNQGGEQEKRYKKKMAIYHRNKINCIWIFPNQLHYVERVIDKGMQKIIFSNPEVIKGLKEGVDSENKEETTRDTHEDERENRPTIFYRKNKNEEPFPLGRIIFLVSVIGTFLYFNKNFGSAIVYTLIIGIIVTLIRGKI